MSDLDDIRVLRADLDAFADEHQDGTDVAFRLLAARAGIGPSELEVYTNEDAARLVDLMPARQAVDTALTVGFFLGAMWAQRKGEPPASDSPNPRD